MFGGLTPTARETSAATRPAQPVVGRDAAFLHGRTVQCGRVRGLTPDGPMRP